MSIPLINRIWSPSWLYENNKTPGIVCFRKCFKLSDMPEEAVIQISADTRYKLCVNGRLCEAGPSKGSLRPGTIPFTGRKPGHFAGLFGQET